MNRYVRLTFKMIGIGFALCAYAAFSVVELAFHWLADVSYSPDEAKIEYANALTRFRRDGTTPGAPL